MDTHQILVATAQTTRKAPGKSQAREHSRGRRAFSLSNKGKIYPHVLRRAREQLRFLPRPHSGLSHLHGAPGDGGGPLVQTGQG